MRKLLLCVSLAALLATGCGEDGGSGTGGSAAVEPRNVSPEQLKAAVSDPRVRAFYEARSWAAVWTPELAGQLTGALGEADRHAINPANYLKEAKGGSPAEREAALTLAAIDYGQALATGAVDPREIWEVYTVPMPKVDVAGGLAKAVEAGRVRQWLAGLAPADAEYRALSEAYLAYRNKAGQEARAPIPAGGKIERGDRDPRVPAIAAALRSNGYLAAAPAAPATDKGKQAGPAAKPRPDSTAYTAEMADAVRRLQADYGIKPDGVIGDGTLEALNNGAVERARILAVNLERRRWLERRPAATRIDVNTGGAFLDYWRDGAIAHRAKVVVGQPEWETPELGTPLTRLVANPPWTIPDSIAEEEILPKGAGYMAREHIAMKNGKLVQDPGPKSALGLVKFDLQNPHQIYLHDTPAKALFASEERHSSHGCARVENAVNFARLLAEHDGKLEAFDEAMATKEETMVDLSKPIPVRLLYHTAYLDGGRVVFRTDPYGWDDRLARALGLGGALRHRAPKHVSDIGP
jgi:murein L,D-transpeptidase YcbB/YkuD